MSKITGGILGNVTGKTAGVVFSSARAKTGKVNTARALVIPANPNTAAQQTQRGWFGAALARLKELSPDLYQSDWNRAVNQLPGFQSLMSVMLNSKDDVTGFEAPADLSLGDLHFPATVTMASGSGSGEIDVTCSSENGSNGTTDDGLVVFAYKVTQDAGVVAEKSIEDVQRVDGAVGVTLTGLTPSAHYIVGFYLRGQGTALGKLSKATFADVTAHA